MTNTSEYKDHMVEFNSSKTTSTNIEHYNLHERRIDRSIVVLDLWTANCVYTDTSYQVTPISESYFYKSFKIASV